MADKTITFGDIQKANALIKTTAIKNKDYAEVNQRIKAFRSLFPMGSISTELVSDSEGVCIFKATIKDESGQLLGTGTAFEEKSSSFINKTSYIENCETSAVGRALAMCGIGIDVSIASAEEMTNAINNQENNERKKEASAKTKNEKKEAPEEPSKAQIIEDADIRTKVLAYINRRQMSADNIRKICMHYKITNINQLTAENCKDYINNLEKNGGNINE